MKQLALAAGGVAVIVFLIVVLLRDDGAAADPPQVRDPAPGVGAEQAESPGGASDPSEVETSRFQEPEDPPGTDAPPPGEPAVAVRVLMKDSRAPVAGAVVSVGDARAYFAAIREKNLAHGSPRSRVIMKEMSRTGTTEEDGIARISRVEMGNSLMIEARKGRLWGFAVANKGTKEPVEILIQVDQVLRVRVASPDGRPRVGVPIALRKRTGERPLRYTQKLTETEAPDGIGFFQHVQRRFELQGNGWHTTLAFPMLDQPTIPVVEGAVPTEPVELVLPGAGTVDIRVRDENGKPLRTEEPIGVFVEAFPDPSESQPIWPDGPWSRPRLDGAGNAQVAWIGLGLHLRVTARATSADSERMPVKVELPGPVTDGETVVCNIVVKAELPLSERYPTVAGRFVRADGTPWSPEMVRVWSRILPRPTKSTRTRDVPVGKDGRFGFLARHSWVDGGTRKYRISTDSGIVTWLDVSRPLQPGVNDVGDVVLDHGVLLAAGQVVDDDGAPVAGARVTVTKHWVSDSGEDYWPDIDCSGDRQTDKEGRFSLHLVTGSEVPSAPLRFSATKGGFARGAAVPIAMGTRSLRYTLSRGGALEGSVALTEGQDPGDVRITIKCAGQYRFPDVKEDGTFAVSGLPPGTARLSASLRAPGSPRTTVDGIEIVSGTTCRDPRIQGMRIEGRAAKITLQIVDESSSPIWFAHVVVVGRPNGRRMVSNQKGVVEVLTESLPVDLEVTAYGYRRARLSAVREDREVVLKKGLRVRLSTSAATHGKDPTWLMTVTVVRKPVGGGPLDYPFLHARPLNGLRFDKNGHLDMIVPEPGTYLISPYLVVLGDVGTGGSLGMKPAPRVVVKETPELQTFRLDIPQALVDKTVERFSKK